MELASRTFLARPTQNRRAPRAKFSDEWTRRTQLRRHRLVLDDGPGDQLGEHGDEGAEVHHAPLDRRVLPVHVDGVAHGLEGVEGDADGQGHAPQGMVSPSSSTLWGIWMPVRAYRFSAKKVPYLKKPSSSQVEDHRLGHEPPGLFVIAPVLLHQQAVGVVDGDGEEHDDDVHRLPPAVEQQAHQQQDEVPPLQGREEVHQQRQRQVEE